MKTMTLTFQVSGIPKAQPMTPDSIANQLEFLARRLRFGCGNSGCQVHEADGLHTNGSCNCQPTNYAKQLMGLAIECERQGYFLAKDE